ncbi:flavin reductase family protein [Alkalilacustris brevis]|uniref:flavin reductase family protein n=1 Tax=Alkalilacustris brevis TaxID=2026338 RepID=UPI000E0CFBE3|nr:flavin reductase family protein [Alkalilacustris brevis]
MHSFAPDAENARLFRQALGRFVTGVTVVTTAAPAGPVGITVNSFTSVSLDPPLVLWCPARASGRFALFAGAAHFAIHVLAAEQRALSHRFARGAGLFDDLSPEHTPEGVPVLPDVLARFDCALYSTYDGGDHAIVVGRVLRASQRNGAPLVFSGGDYGQVSAAM